MKGAAVRTEVPRRSPGGRPRRSFAIRGAPLLAALLLAVPARGQTRQVWSGILRCATIPGAATLVLHQPITITVAGNRATYERSVRRSNTAVATPYTEDGAGTVAPDGSVVLTAEVNARSFAYTARYEGVLPPQGGHARLVGAQTWLAGTSEPGYRRRCSMELDRQ